MGIDINSGYSTIRYDNVTYDTNDLIDPTMTDFYQTVQAKARFSKTQTETDNTYTSLISSYYVPYISTSATYYSKYLYRDSNNGGIGYYVND